MSNKAKLHIAYTRTKVIKAGYTRFYVALLSAHHV